MKGFYIAIGSQGSGKTLFITKHCIDNITPNRKIYSNYSLFGVPYQRIGFDIKNETTDTIDILKKLDEVPDFFNDSIMLIDEIHIYFDSRDFMRSNIRHIQTFFSQLRKRNILLLATTQYILNLDVRIRRQALAVFEMENVKSNIFRANVMKIDGYFTEFVRSDLYDLSPYYKYYNTNEIIN